MVESLAQQMHLVQGDQTTNVEEDVPSASDVDAPYASDEDNRHVVRECGGH